MSYRTIIDSINAARPYLGYLNPTVGTNYEPAVSAANYTGQLMCSAPLSWAWNRDEKTFVINPGTQDYAQTGWTDFGYLEKASVFPAANITNVDGSGTVATMTANNKFAVGAVVIISGLTSTVFNGTFTITGATTTTFTFASTHSLSSTPDTGLAISGAPFAIDTIYNNNPLSVTNEIGRPKFLAVQDDDGTGNVSLRVMAVPDQTYQVTMTYQKLPPAFAPTVFVATGNTQTSNTMSVAGTFTGGGSNAFAGYVFTLNGFADAGNNGVFTCLTSTAVALTFNNPNGVTSAVQTATAAALLPAGASWSPIPNDFSYIYNAIFLSYLLDTKDESQRSQYWRLKGITSLLAKQGGLDQKQTQMFLQAHLGMDLYQQYQQLNTQQSAQARAQ